MEGYEDFSFFCLDVEIDIDPIDQCAVQPLQLNFREYPPFLGEHALHFKCGGAPLFQLHFIHT